MTWLFVLVSCFLHSSLILDWEHPSIEDYKVLQRYLHEGARPELDLAIEYTAEGRVHDTRRVKLLRNFCLISQEASCLPSLEVVACNTSFEDRRCCVITYSSWNEPYLGFPEKIKKALLEKGFCGHFLFQVGGWPYVEEGGLRYFDVPYAFKVCMFQEARKRGYEKVFWLDVSAIPKTNLSSLFDELDEVKGLFLQDMLPFKWRGLRYILQTDGRIVALMGSSWEEIRNMSHLNGKLIGLDLREEKNRQFLDAWYKMAEKKIPFCNMSVEQIPLSYLAHKWGIIGRIHSDAWFYETFDLLPH